MKSNKEILQVLCVMIKRNTQCIHPWIPRKRREKEKDRKLILKNNDCELQKSARDLDI